jgi:uncharacterized ion transporter superfamily protein YfcC
MAIFYVYRYAKKAKAEGRTILTAAEKAASEEEYKGGIQSDVTLTGSQKVSLIIFALSFVVMIISLIPWASFGITMPAWTGVLVGVPFGDWYFQELQAWFTIMAIVIALVSKISERDFVNYFIAGAADMVSVILVIAVSRGISVLMNTTGLDLYVLDHAAQALEGVHPSLFTAGSYIIYIVLSFLIPSTSGLAGASMGTFGGLAHRLGLSPEVMIMVFCAACGVVNLITPTSAVVMGGTSLSKIEYATWLKFALKFAVVLAVVTMIILSAVMLIL